MSEHVGVESNNFGGERGMKLFANGFKTKVFLTETLFIIDFKLIFTLDTNDSAQGFKEDLRIIVWVRMLQLVMRVSVRKLLPLTDFL